jgi:MHS family alpha-ketoglutarate permease-like MFS transporter
MLCGSFGIGALIAYPLHRTVLGAASELEAIVLCTIPLVVLSAYTSISAIFKAELFPAHLRALGVALPYSIALAIFSGNAQSTALAFKAAGNESGFYILLTVLFACGFIATLVMKDPKKYSLITEE